MTLQELYEFAEKFVKVGKGSGTVSADINLYAAFGKVRGNIMTVYELYEYLDKLIEDEKGDYEVLTEDGYLHIIEERIEIDTVKEEIRL